MLGGAEERGMGYLKNKIQNSRKNPSEYDKKNENIYDDKQ
jgi:hypothetical protein